MDRRLVRVEELMLDGAGRTEVVRALAADRIPERTVDDYIRRVRERWVAESQAERPITRARQLRRLYRNLKLLRTESRHKDVLGFEKLIADLEGNARSPGEPDPIARPRPNLSWEQIEYMAANRGKIPPGVTLDDLEGL